MTVLAFLLEEMAQLDTGERNWVEHTARRKNRLTLAVMLKFFQMEKCFPENILQIPPALIICLANTFGINDVHLEQFDWHSQMAKRFQRAIRRYLGFRAPTVADREILISWLIANILDGAPTVEQCIAHADAWLYRNGIEPIAPGIIERVIHSALHRYEQALQSHIAREVTANTQASLDALLNGGYGDDSNEPSTQIRVYQLKRDIQGTKLAYLQEANTLLEHLQKIGLPVEVMEKIPRAWLQKYALRVSIEFPSQLKDHPPHTRYALLASFCFMRLQLLTDQMTTALLKMIKKLKTSAEGYVTRKITAEVRRVNGKFDILHQLAKTSAEQPTGIIQDTIYPQISRETLQNVAAELSFKGRWFQHHVHIRMHTLYSHAHRRTLFTALSLLKINTDQPGFMELSKALQLIVECRDETAPAWTSDQLPLLDPLPNYWQERIVKKQGENKESICRLSYEMAVFESLYSPLRSKAMWVCNAWRYRHPDKDLPADFTERKEYYYQLLDLPKNSDDFIRPLQKKMAELLAKLNDLIPDNPKIKIIDKNNGHIKLSPFEPQEEPVHLHALQQEIQQRWSSLSLLDVLKEAEHRTRFCSHFHTAGHHEIMEPEELRKKLLLCLYALGSNTGLKRMSVANTEVTESDLRYVKRRFLHADNVRVAIRQVVNSILAERDREIWPSLTGCACDSTLLSSWDQNLLTEWHGRYRKHGVMIYWHVDKKSTCIYSQLKTCTSSEVAAMLKGVLHHLTDMDMRQGYVDTHGKSTVGFGICYLLHFDLLPRLKSLARQKLCCVYTGDKKKYPHLAPIMKESINWELIAKYYDEMVQHIAALKTGTVEPDVLINRFSKDNSTERLSSIN